MYPSLPPLLEPTTPYGTQVSLPKKTTIPEGPINHLVVDLSKHIFSYYLTNQDVISAFQVSTKWKGIAIDIFLPKLHRHLLKLFDQVSALIAEQIDEKLKNGILPELLKHKEEIDKHPPYSFDTPAKYQQFFLAQKEPLVKILSHFSKDRLNKARLSLPLCFGDLLERANNTFHCESWIDVGSALTLTAEHLKNLTTKLPESVKNQCHLSVHDQFIDIVARPKKDGKFLAESTFYCFIPQMVLASKIQSQNEIVLTFLSADHKQTYYLHLRPEWTNSIENDFNLSLQNAIPWGNERHHLEIMIDSFSFIPPSQT